MCRSKMFTLISMKLVMRGNQIKSPLEMVVINIYAAKKQNKIKIVREKVYRVIFIVVFIVKVNKN